MAFLYDPEYKSEEKNLEDDINYLIKNSFVNYRPYIPLIISRTVDNGFDDDHIIKIDPPNVSNTLFISDDPLALKIYDRNKDNINFWKKIGAIYGRKS